MTRLSCLLVLAMITGPTAWAAPTDKIVHPPLVVVGAEGKEAKRFEPLLAKTVRFLGFASPSSADVQSFLKNQASGKCVDDDCLERLARATDSGRAVLISVAPFLPKVFLAGKVVHVDGTPTRALTSREFVKKPGEKLEGSVERALQQFLKDAIGQEPVREEPKLRVERPAATEPKTAAPPALDTPAAESEVEPSASLSVDGQRATWRSKAAPFVGGAGLAALVMGTVFQVSASGSWSDFNTLYDGRPVTPSQLEDVRSVRQRAEGQQTAATVFWVVGATALASSVALYLSDSPMFNAPSARPELAVSPNGISLSGVFP